MFPMCYVTPLLLLMQKTICRIMRGVRVARLSVFRIEILLLINVIFETVKQLAPHDTIENDENA